MPDTARSAPVARWPNQAWAVPAIVGVAYAWVHLMWYRGTALGQSPVLDEQELLAFAEAMVRGELPHEAFYRAAGYPLILAALREVGVSTGRLFFAALALGTLLHGINAALITRIGARWFRPAGALVGGMLFALN